jgi:chromosome segregation protein
MKLKKLEILGFKSFPERTVLDFSGGISSIVGPNGCGKSNILDSIRWVMGEQSARLLRGKKMEDVIFNGSDDAQAVNMAEVSITLNNDGRDFPGGYADCEEVMITRRIFRDAESEYFINKIPCRLLDVREFFMDTGVGARTYSLVEQNSVSNLIEAKPEDRRVFIEEAAGIRKYKSRKESATRKMEATRQNLLRLNDVIREVKSQLNAISKQARRAERFKALKKELKEAELTLALQNFSILAEKQASLQSVSEALSARDVEVKTRLRVIESMIEDLRSDILENEGLLHQLQEKLYAVKNDINIKEQGIEFSRGRIGDLSQRREKDLADMETLKDRREKTSQEITALEAQFRESEEKILTLRESITGKQGALDDLKNREKTLHRELEEKKAAYFDLLTENGRLKNLSASLIKGIEDLRRRSERENRDIDENRRRMEEIQASLARLSETVREDERAFEDLLEKEKEALYRIDVLRRDARLCEEKIATLKEEDGRKSSRLFSLKEFQEGYLWCSEATRSIMKAGREQLLSFGSVYGLVADHIEVPREYEVAVEAVLGEKLQYVVVRSQEDGIEAIDYLKTHSSGRGSFIPLEVRSPSNAQSPEYLAGAVRLIDQVAIKDDFRNIASYLLGDVLLIPNLQSGVSLWRRNGFRGTFVTPDGDIISPQGVLTGGNGMNGDSSLLRNKREISELEKEIGHIARDLDLEKDRRDELLGATAGTEAELERLRTELRGRELGIHNGKKDIEGLENEFRWVEERMNILTFNRENLSSEETQAAERMTALEHDIAMNEERLQSANEAIASLKESWDTSRAGVEDLDRGLTEEKILFGSLEEKRSAGRETLERLKTSTEDMAVEIDIRISDMEACDHDMAEISRNMEEEREALRALYDAHRVTEEDLAKRTSVQREKEELLRTRELEGQEIKRDLDRLTAEAGERQMEMQGLLFEMEMLRRSAEEKHHADLNGLAATFERLDETQIEGLADKVSQNSRAVEDFGEVNLLALSEQDELQARYDFLTAQVADLNASLDALQRTISRINRISRQRFSETFEAVNTCFKEVFPKLFPGGRAELKLTDESDMLETGVDMEIRIPGKRTQNVMLLSGGEKALAAVALIFSIILFRPTPFLILDEVDAALDDANIALFNQLLKDISRNSQIVLITHNKKTMEVAEYLYGVTMEKKGITSLVSVSLH